MHSCLVSVFLCLSWQGSDSRTWNQSPRHIHSLSFGPLVSTLYYVSDSGEAAKLPSKVVTPPPLSPSLAVWTVLATRAGLHYSLLSLLNLRLQSLVLHFPVPVALSCCGLQPYLPGPQSSCGCVLLSTLSTLFPIIFFPLRWRQNILPTCPHN